MKNHFEFFGITSPRRREVCKPFLQKSTLPSKEEGFAIIKKLWLLPQREYQYFAQELAAAYTKQLEKEDIELIEFMIINRAWWDTVDFIAAKLSGDYFTKHPKQIIPVTNRWMASGNMWLQRTCVLFQLKYNDKVNTDILTHFIQQLTGSKEFFINKAIGWMLREYSKTNPDWVKNFVTKNKLSNLSRREALRLIEK
jgi:3-methyladenine DNA glycosylase AlkD